MKKTSPLQYIMIYSILLVAVAWSIYPILRVITISIRPGDNLLTESLSIIPDDWTFDNYIKLFVDHPFGTWIWNSILVTVTVVITGVALASTAGYALSRFRFPGREASLLSLLVTQMFPATMLLLPLFIMLSSLHLINTYLGLIVIYSSTALPFCVWQMKGYYDTIPYSLEEAARIDGASRFMAFYKIILPLASPALVITALFSFMSAWTEYIVAAQVLWYEEMFTLPIGLKSFQANMTTEWGLYAAGAMIVSVPAIALFLFLTKYLIGGLTLGSVKG
ncbi:MAG: sugar ABC transporter permease [Candidatus Marinimicrobia bacterium]|jgi:arabinogalactan oligomer / maltooligosaccharide transport system permease protein|nr:sugar ABC transporter permease [Candidatus Neomarinimicrobiota bacterium]MBT3632529.1 sugar ABC transporter permease [Candidatus Neomarinimicrobiota bacterium]MBT3824928.1 sugar ABC transporter permease [Candidatus Neomarinimicrobiota bacterium]MBT4132797.1 sugar ABC transporter permease [Candidatus Neomarinimicrobiota bacterium]MBT4295281.1 sugar ABC transporter permease [Candidatus Neomarinimicrobiota bacterium]